MFSFPSDDELISRRLDSALQVEDAERLSERLRSDPRLLEIYLDLVELDAFLSWELTGATPMPEHCASPPRQHHLVASVVAVTVFIAVIGAAWVLRPGPPEPIAVAPNPSITVPEPALAPEPPQIGTFGEIDGKGTAALGNGDLIEKGHRLRLGDQLRVSENAFVTLQLDHGVRLLLEGPTSLDLGGRKRVSLLQGRVLGTVSPEATGFTVEFPGGAVRDLGTQFAVASSESRAAEVKLLSGIVELEADGKQLEAPAIRLSRNGAARLTATGTFEPLDESSTSLDSIIAFDRGISRIEGSIRFLHGDLPAPDFRRTGDPRIDVFLEKVGGHVSTPINVHAGSEHPSHGPLQYGVYDCYLLRFAQVQTPDPKSATATATGTIVFRGPVAGWIVDSSELASSDAFVASPERRSAWVRQPGNSRKNRGWEPGDVITLRPDGRALDVTLNAAAAIDEVRVFVRAHSKVAQGK